MIKSVKISKLNHKKTNQTPKIQKRKSLHLKFHLSTKPYINSAKPEPIFTPSIISKVQNHDKPLPRNPSKHLNPIKKPNHHRVDLRNSRIIRLPNVSLFVQKVVSTKDRRRQVQGPRKNDKTTTNTPKNPIEIRLQIPSIKPPYGILG